MISDVSLINQLHISKVKYTIRGECSDTMEQSDGTLYAKVHDSVNPVNDERWILY